jgi:hypothetical protein
MEHRRVFAMGNGVMEKTLNGTQPSNVNDRYPAMGKEPDIIEISEQCGIAFGSLLLDQSLKSILLKQGLETLAILGIVAIMDVTETGVLAQIKIF